MPVFQFNAFFPGGLVVLCTSLYFAFFILRIRNKTSATLHLGLTMLFMALFNLVYAARYAVSAEWVAYLRWASIPLILPTMIHWTQYLLRFGEVSNARFAQRLLILQWVMNAGITVWFVIRTAHVAVMTNFQGHYFDLEADGPSVTHSMFIVLFLLGSLVATFWRGFTLRGAQRQALLIQGCTIFFVLIIPAIMSVMSRDGFVSHETYQETYSITVTLGLFVIVTVFLNIATENTPLMSRIVGISVVAFLLIMQLISRSGLAETQAAFARQATTLGKLWLVAPGEKPMDASSNLIPYGFNTRADLGEINSWRHDRLLLSAWRQGADVRLIAKSLKLPYSRSLLDLVSHRCSLAGSAGRDDCLQKPDRELRLAANLTRRIPEAGFDIARLMALFSGSADKIPLVMSAFQSLDTQIGSGRQFSRQEVLEFLRRPQPAGEPDFFMDGGKRFVGYIWHDQKNMQVAEVVMPYEHYQQAIHATSQSIAAIIIVGVIVLTVVFPVFFSITLVTPLAHLMGAVRKVQTGYLEEKVHIRGSDELAELGRAFNAMTAAVKESRGELRQYAQELEEKVSQRTKNLQESLAEIHALKKQQDGDYFLTSLLLNPLGKNRVESKMYNVEFLIQQKKRFDFRAWQSEIGGDLCISDQLELNGQRYIVLLNADAMGKSMQGAGGAVVIGSIFHAIVERNRHTKQDGKEHPEGWIRDTFAELQRVFVVFDGSMLVSVFVALVDERTGVLYFVNAEHPWPVVIRAGKASFLRHKIFLRKLGVVPPETRYPWSLLREDSPIAVETFQLCEGDILIVGSDGRDDLMVGQSGADAARVINEDEKLFLHVAASANGNLDEIVQKLRSVGEIVDDLSLIKLTVKNGILPDTPMQAALRKQIANSVSEDKFEVALALTDQIPSQRDRAAYRAFINFQASEYPEAEVQAKKALELTSFKSDVLYLLSRIGRRLTKTREAIHYGERFRMRNPCHINNLANLASLYLMEREFDRAEHLALQIVHFDETHTMASRLLKVIEETRIQVGRFTVEPDKHATPVVLNDIG